MTRVRSAGDGARRWLRVVTSPPWRRAPLLVGRSPALAVGVAVAAFVLGLAGASRPVFSASAGRASLLQDLDEGCAFEVGFRAERTVPLVPDGAEGASADPLAASRQALDEATGSIDGLQPIVRTVFGGRATVAPAEAGDVDPAAVQLIERTGSAENVDVIAGGDEPGVWLTDTVAEPLGLAPGDDVSLTTGTGEVVTLPVAAVYRDLRLDRSRWWCTMRYTFEAPSAGGSEPPPVALLDGVDLPGLVADTGGDRLDVWWEYAPDPDHWDLETAQEATSALTGAVDESNDRISGLFLALGGGTSSVDRPASVDKAEATVTAVESVAGPVAWGTIGVAVTMLLTAARSWLSRRSQQVTVLTLRGAGPVALGLKAAGELLPAIAVGVAAGVAAAVAMVRVVGPDPRIESGALTEGLAVVGAATVVALVAVVLVVAAGARRVGVGIGGAAPRRTLLPWEPVVLAVAAAALYEVQTRPPIRDGTRVDGLLLVFPLLLFAGGAGAVARVVLSRRVLDAVAARAPGAVWLAARRLAAGRARASLIVTGAAISIGIVVFAGATSSSVRATATAKATLGDGAAQIVRLSAHAEPPAAAPLPGISTLVTRTDEPTVVREGHDRSDVLGVDPDTFADGAFWDATFADRSLGSLLDAIDVPADADADVLPAIAVGDGLPDRLVVTLRGEDGNVAQEVEVVARARAFPGFESSQERPLIVLDRSALTRLGVVEHPEVWIDDDDPAIPDRLADDGLTIIYSRRAAADVNGTLLQPQVWAIDYLEVIGLAAGLVTVAGLGLHFAADAERRRLGAALARRLGLPGRQVTGATLVEVAAILLGGLVLGVALAWIAVRLVFRKLDPVPRTPPEALLRYDLALVGVCAAVAVVVAVVVTLVVERRSARSSLPELLRAAR